MFKEIFIEEEFTEAIKHIKNPTPEMAHAAVKYDGRAIKNITPADVKMNKKIEDRFSPLILKIKDEIAKTDELKELTKIKLFLASEYKKIMRNI